MRSFDLAPCCIFSTFAEALAASGLRLKNLRIKKAAAAAIFNLFSETPPWAPLALFGCGIPQLKQIETGAYKIKPCANGRFGALK